MKTVLVTGASGYLGWFVSRELVRRGRTVIGTSRDGDGMPAGVVGRRLVLDDGGLAAAALVREVAPEAVVHCAAMSDVNACAREPERAERVNSTATGALAQAAAHANVRLIYTSTDLVFDGSCAPYDERSTPSPTGPYMQSKLAGEERVLGASLGFLVVRVALVYGLAGGRHGKFSDRMVAWLKEGQSVDLWRDQYRTAVEVSDAAALLCDLLDADAGGILHLGGPERVSRYDMGLGLASALGLETSLCRSTSIEADPRFAGQPRDTSFDVSRLREVVGRDALGLAAGCRLSALRSNAAGTA
jgi:dTDP-4-dehydrorhamnose reductase